MAKPLSRRTLRYIDQLIAAAARSNVSFPQVHRNASTNKIGNPPSATLVAIDASALLRRSVLKRMRQRRAPAFTPIAEIAGAATMRACG